jgi:diaminopimelate epimerase
MKKNIIFIISFLLIQCNSKSQNLEINKISDIPVPNEYERIHTETKSFANFLQNQTLNKSRNEVLLYNKQPKKNQNAHFAILNIDIGNKDLQQCADAIIRLRAEYLWAINKKEEIHFNFTSGDTAYYTKYKKGFRASISGNKVTWQKKTQPDSSYSGFQKYLENVFMYAGTYSLNKELIKIRNPEQLEIGDVFIQTGNPIGHAIIVVDIAINKNTEEKIYLLAQSYMPAQDIHILKNPSSQKLSPWYLLNPQSGLVTPEWTFSYNHLKRFKD